MMTDQTGRVAIVTGSTSGIGLETGRVLACKGATVILAARDRFKGRTAVTKIKTAFPEAAVVFRELDLADLASVRRFASEVASDYERLDLLINNAGVMVPPYAKTKDGFELQFGTNHLGHFALTGLLMDRLKATDGSRVVNVSSIAHKAGRIDFTDLGWEQRKYKRWQAYGDSKIANLYFTYELSRRQARLNTQVTAAAAHPGWTATDLQRHSGPTAALNHIFAQKIRMGALPTLYAAVGPDVQGGDFYGPSGVAEMRGYPKKVSSSRLSQDREIAERLWEVSERLTSVHYGEKLQRAA
jgi:NAD(P)-dependent dehydrogenase (short-subunit alcohol dehydrogenase family)